MEDKLTSITLRGYKSIRSLDDFEIRPINVLIGANGSGKSNLISFFRMLSWMLEGRNLQTHVAEIGELPQFCTMVPSRPLRLKFV